MIDRLLIATGNDNKRREIQAVLEERRGAPVTLLTLRDLEGAPVEPVEDGDTFEANATLKARYYARATNLWCLADDSGLEVDALGGEPGVRSARYAGAEGTRRERDQANNAKLLSALAEVGDTERAARFVCVMALADPDGIVHFTARGVFEGRVGREPRGENGFGYDPLLVLPEGGTVAELVAAEKNARSHRGQATRQMAAYLLEQWQAGGDDSG